ncbi:uncharacterized protein LOC118201531 [Stegodyphus dumicola]|uniref:uncharacterized protein LOC118201531 n=2 Tax=Stegodyphus dumicola TaxID=202533 RepID=UPI0015B0C511|nr:uncharacterized protein LOC118201531 [Stegodyphus dumicola]
MTRLRFHLHQHQIISSRQYGFRPGSSTLHALHDITQDILNNKFSGYHTALVSLDLKSAFDSLWWVAIKQALVNSNCPSNIYKVLEHYLQDRRLIAVHPAGIIEKVQTRGCPQGSCAGPQLWNLTFNKILQAPWPDHTHIYAYADDVALVIRGHSREVLQQNCNESLQLFQQHCDDLKLIIAENKSKVLLVPKKGGSLVRRPRIVLNSHRLQILREIKYLGVIIDDKLTWIPHILSIKKRTQMIAKQLRYLQGYRWGLNHHIQKILYTTVTEKIVTYAAAVWALPMQGRKVKHLSTIQRPFALSITRAYITTSSDSLNVLAGLLPLHIRTEEEAVRQLLVQLRRPITFDGEHYLPDDYEAKLKPFSIHPADYGVGVRLHIPPSVFRNSSSHVIYTDGSKIDDNVGSAFVAFRDNLPLAHWKGHLSMQNSVFQGEAVAIARAIRYLLTQNITQATINSDSLSVIHAIGNPEHSSPIIRDIQQDLRASPSFTIHIAWVKAHVGEYGNELADAYAKEAASGDADENISIPWPHSFLKRTLRLRAISKWQEEWDNSFTGRRTFYHLSYVSTDRCCGNAHLSRYISGHGPFPEFFARFGISDTNVCSCGELGSPEHYLANCPLTEGLHIRFPTQNRQAFCKLLVKQRHLIRKLNCVMEKVSSIGLDLCQV